MDTPVASNNNVLVGFIKALGAYSATYVLYCEAGILSSYLRKVKALLRSDCDYSSALRTSVICRAAAAT